MDSKTLDNVKNYVSSSELFHKQANSFIKTLFNAFGKLDDDQVTVEEYTSDSLTISVKDKGSYIIEIEKDLNFLCLNSPISGFFKYTYDENCGFWVNIKDQHILDDLLIREFCKHSKGMLEIN